jgi:radical SAM/Cys-rich protein
MNPKTSLKHRGNPLSNSRAQLAILNPANVGESFESRLQDAGWMPLTANGVEILQVNVGKMCNMTCVHCHVDAGPDRKEIMDRAEIDACINALAASPAIKTIDLTGGAPEMNPHFRDLVVAVRELDRHVIDRCNLTILLTKGHEDLAEFLAANRVEIVASLPCYLEENTDAQRGDGAFSKSIEALLKLNSLGYGKPNTGLTLTLVYNPVGQQLPPDQAGLEHAYREQLRDRFGIEFNRLFTITNMPVSRYLEYLVRIGEYESYMDTLIHAFNPAAIDGLMCRNTVSVGWDGKLFDCDFNQMLEMDLQANLPQTIHDFDYDSLAQRSICTGQHCFGCTAGGGSSCQGSTAS